jgi:hypothetical protein
MYKRNNEGIHIINVSKAWEKLMVAARVIASIPNPRDILVSIFQILSFWLLINGVFCLSCLEQG